MFKLNQMQADLNTSWPESVKKVPESALSNYVLAESTGAQ